MSKKCSFSSRVVSDGTLRVLALLTLLCDPQHRGLICFEEPENGIHPERLKTLIQRLREGVTDPTSESVDENEPLSQMLLNSHSPVVLSSLEEGEAMFADTDPLLGSSLQGFEQERSLNLHKCLSCITDEDKR